MPFFITLVRWCSAMTLFGVMRSSRMGVGDLDAGLVGLSYQVGADSQSGGGACGAAGAFRMVSKPVEGLARPSSC